MWLPRPPVPVLATMSLDLHDRTLARHRKWSSAVQRQEERRLAEIIRDPERHGLIMFYSKHCLLCKGLQPALEEVEEEEEAWLGVARLGVDDESQWLPEMLHYNVEQVPCLVLLDREGNALFKTNRPRSLRHMEESLAFMVEAGRPPRTASS